MPLLNIHVVRGRDARETSVLLQAIHDAMVEAFDVPVRDRYQILNDHESTHLILEDTGLGFERSDRRVLIQMATRQRPPERKERFYELVVQHLRERCGVPPEDVMVSLIENGDVDWSFGFGQAQFVTRELT